MTTKISPLAPKGFPVIPPIKGVRLASCVAGVRYRGRPDLLVVELAPGTTVAGAFTRSRCPSAPVDWCRNILAGGKARGLVVNSGNANAFTGKAGEKAVKATVLAAAEQLGCKPRHVFAASTGVIGEPLPAVRITDALPGAVAKLKADAWKGAAGAIMTTDTFPKAALRTALIGETEVTIVGIAKGSGMIAPDMATMLGFLFTDAAIPADVLQKALSGAVDRSFNSITVDSDTSTSDTVLLFATGQSPRHPKVGGLKDKHFRDFRRALDELTAELAQLIVRDGEGATKFVTIRVEGAAGDKAARRIGLAVANSPLVKTAIAGEDANWGRIVAAVGKAGEKADRDRLSIEIGGVRVAERGAVAPGYDETPVAAHMKGQEIDILIDVGADGGKGKGRATVWTCDLTHRYIDINADYRT